MFIYTYAYTYVPKYNILSLYKVTCKYNFSELNIWYWMTIDVLFSKGNTISSTLRFP